MTNLYHIKSLQVIFIFFLCLVKTKGLEGRRTIIVSRFRKISGRVGKKKGKLFYLFSLLSFCFFFFQKRKLIMFKLPQLYSPKTFWSFFFFFFLAVLK